MTCRRHWTVVLASLSVVLLLALLAFDTLDPSTDSTDQAIVPYPPTEIPVGETVRGVLPKLSAGRVWLVSVSHRSRPPPSLKAVPPSLRVTRG